MFGTSITADPATCRQAVLIAHPTPERLGSIARTLAREYPVDVVREGGLAFEALAGGGYRAAIVSTTLPSLSGLEALRHLADLRLESRPRILAVGAADDLRLNVITSHGLADEVQPVPCPSTVLLHRIWRLLDQELEAEWVGLPDVERRLVRSTRGLMAAAAQAVRVGAPLPAGMAETAGRQLVEALETGRLKSLLRGLRSYHDYTYVHSFRVAAHLAGFALAVGMRPADVEVLAQAGLLHDIGKTAVPVAILDKPGPLDGTEKQSVQAHPQVGAEVLRRTPGLAGQLAAITERHHERLDGSGYPKGLTGAALDDASLLCAIADVHTALTDRRAYRDALDDGDAFTLMRSMAAGRGLEPSLLRAYEEVIRDAAW
jgi:putative nucleotidyltransferase with HDIG domain